MLVFREWGFRAELNGPIPPEAVPLVTPAKDDETWWPSEIFQLL